MCYALAVAAQGLSVIGGAVSAYESQVAQNEMLKYNADVAYRNAETTQIQIEYAQQQTSKNATQAAKRSRQAVGTQRASMGASGVLIDSGTFLDVQNATAQVGQEEIAAILEQGDAQVFGLQRQQENYYTSAEMALASMRSPNRAAATALIGGTGRAIGSLAPLAYASSTSGGSSAQSNSFNPAASGVSPVYGSTTPGVGGVYPFGR